MLEAVERPLLREGERPAVAVKVIRVDGVKDVLHNARVLVVSFFNQEAVVFDTVDWTLLSRLSARPDKQNHEDGTQSEDKFSLTHRADRRRLFNKTVDVNLEPPMPALSKDMRGPWAAGIYAGLAAIARSKVSPRSESTTCAQLRPGAPVTDAPGWVVEPV